MSTPEFSTEELLKLLTEITEAIKEKQLDVDTQERIWNSLLWDKNDPDNKELIKYLFTGWWIHQNIPQQENTQDGA